MVIRAVQQQTPVHVYLCMQKVSGYDQCSWAMFLAKLARHTTIDSSKLVNNDHELAVERTLVWPEMLVDLACTRVLLYTAA